MRHAAILLSLIMLCGCTALVVGGSSGGSYPAGGNERSPGVVASDSAITTRIRAKFDADPVVRAFNLRIRTYEGKVTLSGTVANYIARGRALDLAKGTAGVQTVTNQIDIEDKKQ